MIPAELALQIAITAALKASGGIGAAVADTFPENQPYPFVRTGDDQVVPNPADCLDRSADVTTTLHVFTDGKSRRQVKTIAGVIIDRLDNADLDLGPGWLLNTIEHKGTRVLDDPSGAYHAVVTFTALLDPA